MPKTMSQRGLTPKELALREFRRRLQTMSIIIMPSEFEDEHDIRLTDKQHAVVTEHYNRAFERALGRVDAYLAKMDAKP